MDFTADKVYEGYLLSGTLIDPPSRMTATHSILEDDDGQVIPISFYQTEKMSQSLFSIGQRVTIINPYMRQANDGSVRIRVDDSKTVFFGDCVPICWSCCQTEQQVGKLLLCARCKKAQYCSKECQEFDWKQVNHKAVCN